MVRDVTRIDSARRDQAFAYWDGEGARSVTATARHLDIPERTVRHWAKTGSWALRAARERLSSVPEDVFERLALTVAETAMIGADYRLRVLLGQEEPDKLKVLIANTAMAEMGFVAPKDAKGVDLGKHTSRGIDTPTADMLARMTPDQIRAYEQGRPVALPSDTPIIEIHPPDPA